jgi:hypothetical protein
MMQVAKRPLIPEISARIVKAFDKLHVFFIVWPDRIAHSVTQKRFQVRLHFEHHVVVRPAQFGDPVSPDRDPLAVAVTMPRIARQSQDGRIRTAGLINPDAKLRVAPRTSSLFTNVSPASFKLFVASRTPNEDAFG